MDFIDSFARTHRLSGYQAAKRSARVSARAKQNEPLEGPSAPPPMDDTMFILKYGKAALRERRSFGAVTYTPEGWPIVPFCGKR